MGNTSNTVHGLRDLLELSAGPQGKSSPISAPWSVTELNACLWLEVPLLKTVLTLEMLLQVERQTRAFSTADKWRFRMGEGCGK